MLEILYQKINLNIMVVGLSGNRKEIEDFYNSSYNHKFTDGSLHWWNEIHDPFFAIFYVKLNYREPLEIWKHYFFNASIFKILGENDPSKFKSLKDGIKRQAIEMANERLKTLKYDTFYTQIASQLEGGEENI